MNVFDFVKQDEMDGLPEDTRLAFSIFVRTAQRRLTEFTRTLSGSTEESDWREIQEARHSFTNVVLGAARRLKVEPFVSMDVPRINKFEYDAYRQFTADLDHYMTQLALDNTLRSRAESTTLPTASKDRIRSHLHHLRDAIRTADLTEAKKAKLFTKVEEFETALDKTRLNLMAVTLLTVEILGIPGTLWGSYEVVSKLIGNINQAVAEAKAVDDEQRRLPPAPEPYAISPPRAPKPEPSFGRELDDEIPF
ncbi:MULTISPECIES: hypothetical protein [unclassified Mesorhizobium]|uniref:hypothetical protein n=1 Tax=unclassified Mesorhizobium TaxID=325217 RepID=UPI001CCE8941|nr:MULTISPECIES: hypothetical protein [unclassified Mesorhizobium]MBZ9741920.1 hypothetical protein [Mesorhizobium sp. CO1-1-4]MBZ9800177.1 hypothetical protein [Mesorhizobium sp. ES1-6]